ncbi:DNA polymerase B elongation subunit [Halosimplex carlsbadense 2-9-1]|uniref:DNA polymerase B elongation subunit n=1 Tax=Halosimplex carlsbadense 2-9-1 TaxID=797114 RepID=M0CHE0_9EURY|nr:Hint domain-containing protein [Halosimplex carlsbadense]ELZ21782.1 DNA polymerase B elongation subunit [Halosimplex carlsbadense 2-9-1]
MSTEIAGEHGDESFQETTTGSCELAAGGFTPETEVITATGPVAVADLAPGDLVYTLDLTTQLAKLKPVTNVQQVAYEDDLVALETRRCDFLVHPDHRMICRTKGQDDLEIRTARNLDAFEYYKLSNEWRTIPGERLGEVDITEFLDDYEMCAATDVHGHTVRRKLPDGCEPIRRSSHFGYFFDPETFERYRTDIEAIATEVTIHAGPNCHRRPYRFDGDDFIEFLGWFVTEGSASDSTTSDTIRIQIAQQDPDHRPAIRTLLERMGLLGRADDQAFSFSSTVFGRLFRSLCGTECHDKHLPSLIWRVAPDQQQLLYETLLAGDADGDETYYTTSDQLAAQVCRLHVELGLKPRRSIRRGTWRVRGRAVNDGFQSSRHVQYVPYQGDLYRLTVADYPSVLAGRNGVFQWTGVSGVA